MGVDIAFPGGIRGRRRVNEEYAPLYATLQQDSRDLNEPFTNITGGLGVFTAFAADTTSVTVIK